MANLLDPSSKLIEQNPELRAYIYQILQEFEHFVTPHTKVIVLARDPVKLASKLELEGIEISTEDLKKMHRISIIMNESGTKIESEGLHEDPYEALQIAKNSLLGQLWKIQESVVSSSERNSAIQQFIHNTQVH